MKKLAITLACLISIVLVGSAQQLPQVSQFMLNDYAINTAVAGKQNIVEARLLNRLQWTGITDAPRTFNLSVQGATKNPKIGVGGLLYSDNAGPTRRTGVKLSYAYHLNLTENWKLGLSAGLGALQFSIDGTRIDLDEEGDPALFSDKRSQMVFDASFSALAYRDNFFVGITLPQLLQNQLDLFESTTPELTKLEDHYYIIAGYEYEVSEKWTVAPSVLAKYVAPAPMKIDAGLRVIFDKKIWLGGTFRTNDAIAMLVGYNHNDQFSIGYAYDMSTTEIRSFSDSTHELTLAFRVNK